MADELKVNENSKQMIQEKDARDFFLALKSNYETQREPWEYNWRQARAAYHLTDDLDKVYEGRAKIQVPIMKWKVNGISARINKILFNIEPIGRIEDTKVDETKKEFVDLMSQYIFSYQLDHIQFKECFKKFIKCKTIEGTSVAKITQEFMEKEFSFFDDEEEEAITVRDNTYFRPMLLEEFYSDVNKEDINDSQACIHSTVVSMQELLANEKKTETEEFELVDPQTGQVVGTEEERKETGLYHNLGLLQLDGNNITDEQEKYIEFLGLNRGQAQAMQKSLKSIKKTGFVHLDECYGKYDLDGDGIAEEVICTIAEGNVVIRLEPTPFKHRRYVRPFIVGRYEPIANCLYGASNVISGLNLLQELNASRAQSTDAKTRSISNMWYMDKTKSVNWDGTWRPNGIIKGQGPNGMVPLINPNLSNVSINDSILVQQDIDKLWSLSPVQEGTSNQANIPKTARATAAVIAQNDMPLNDIVDNTINNELKPFIEILYERNLVFKDVEDLLIVWEPKDLERAGITPDTDMKEFLFDVNVKILGNLELSNEIAHQQGYSQFIQFAMQVPPLAKRLDWQVIGDKMLRSFGIKDDAEGIWIDPEILAQSEQQQQQAEQQAMEQQKQEAMLMEEKKNQDEARKYQFETETDVEAKLVEMTAEASLEASTGQKVQ